jgi:hypothetical protein
VAEDGVAPPAAQARQLDHAFRAEAAVTRHGPSVSSFVRPPTQPSWYHRFDKGHDRARGVDMLSAKLIELIEIHASRLTSDVARDLITNERTRGFRAVPVEDLERRIFEIFHHLGNWIGEPKAERVQAEFAGWGRRRFDQRIPLSEIIYAVILLKHHLRGYIRDNGLIEGAVPRVESDYVLPMHLHGLQDLNARVGQFFDEAVYHLACGYEAEASRAGHSG